MNSKFCWDLIQACVYFPKDWKWINTKDHAVCHTATIVVYFCSMVCTRKCHNLEPFSHYFSLFLTFSKSTPCPFLFWISLRGVLQFCFRTTMALLKQPSTSWPYCCSERQRRRARSAVRSRPRSPCAGHRTNYANRWAPIRELNGEHKTPPILASLSSTLVRTGRRANSRRSQTFCSAHLGSGQHSKPDWLTDRSSVVAFCHPSRAICVWQARRLWSQSGSRFPVFEDSLLW